MENPGAAEPKIGWLYSEQGLLYSEQGQLRCEPSARPWQLMQHRKTRMLPQNYRQWP